MAKGSTPVGGASTAYLAYLQQQITLLSQAISAVNPFTRYTFVQSVASTSWSIPHNLNTRPEPIVVDNSGNTILCEVDYPDLNHMTLKFNPAQAGTCYYI